MPTPFNYTKQNEGTEKPFNLSEMFIPEITIHPFTSTDTAIQDPLTDVITPDLTPEQRKEIMRFITVNYNNIQIKEMLKDFGQMIDVEKWNSTDVPMKIKQFIRFILMSEDIRANPEFVRFLSGIDREAVLKKWFQVRKKAIKKIIGLIKKANT